MADSSSSIGEVINLLKADFPEISVSKVRFLENQGLISPARTDSGYRQFDATDVDRLRFILQQQRDHFLPLKVIKSKLTDWDRGDDVVHDERDPQERYLDASADHVAEAEFERRSGLEADEVKELISHGLLRRETDGGFDADALAIGKELRVLLDLGLEGRHLRLLRLGADREADVLRQLSAPLRRNTSPAARSDALELLATAAKSFEAIHFRLLRQELRAILDE